MLMLSSMNDEVSSTSSKIVEQIEVIPKVVLSEVSKLSDSVFLTLKQSSWEKGLHKIKNGFTIHKNPEISYQLMDRVIK